MNEINLYKYLVDNSNLYTLETIAFNMAITAVLALFMFFIYKITFSGVFYSLSFNVSLVIISMITSMVIMVIGNNLGISLGMVGALSIVRFRSAIKEPRDLTFLFWAIAIGLASGSGAFLIGGISSFFIGVMILLFSRVVHKENCYLLVMKGSQIDTKEVEKSLKQYGIKNKLRLHNVGHNSMEVTFEVFIKDQKKHTIIEYLKESQGIEEVNLVSFNGEVTG